MLADPGAARCRVAERQPVGPDHTDRLPRRRTAVPVRPVPDCSPLGGHRPTAPGLDRRDPVPDGRERSVDTCGLLEQHVASRRTGLAPLHDDRHGRDTVGELRRVGTEAGDLPTSGQRHVRAEPEVDRAGRHRRQRRGGGGGGNGGRRRRGRCQRGRRQLRRRGGGVVAAERADDEHAGDDQRDRSPDDRRRDPRSGGGHPTAVAPRRCGWPVARRGPSTRRRRR